MTDAFTAAGGDEAATMATTGEALVDALGADLRAMILQRKMDADEVSLTFYTEDGEVAFFVTRNLNDPPWRVRFATPDEDAVRHSRLAMHAPVAAEDHDGGARAPIAARAATWTPLVLLRTENAAEELVATTMGQYESNDQWIYLYQQGREAAAPPPFECLSYDRRASPANRAATEARVAELAAFRRGCVRGSAAAWLWRKGVDSLLAAVMLSIRSLVAEA